MLPLDISFWDLFLIQFQQTSLFEWIGLITTLICIYLATVENVWNWPVSIISIVISAFIYFKSGLFGDFYLQFHFLFTAFYGWYYWLEKKKENDKPIVSISLKEWSIAIVAILVFSGVFGILIDKFTLSDVPYEDGFCTAMSFVAQLMLTRKVLQNWILWIIVDTCYVPLLIYKGLNVYAVLYGILVILAIKGYLDWRKIYRGQAN